MTLYNLGTVVGNGISSVEKISSANNVDTYRINFTDGTHFDYEVTSADISEIEAYIDNLIGNIEEDMMAWLKMTFASTYLSRKQLLVDKLVSKGVTGYTSSDGLTTLINAISEIEGGAIETLTLISDKTVLSQYDSDVATLTAILLDGGVGVSGEEITFDIGSVISPIVETNSQGVAQTTYTSTGAGDVTLSITGDSLSSTLAIEDCIYYDTQTTDKSRYSVTSGGATITYGTNGVTIVGTQASDCLVRNTALTLPTSYSATLTLTALDGDTSSGVTYYGGLCFDNILLDFASNKIDIYLLASLSRLTTINEGVAVGDVLKIDMDNGDMDIYLNDVLISALSEVDHTGIYQHRSYKRSGSTGRTIGVKNLNIKPFTGS